MKKALTILTLGALAPLCAHEWQYSPVRNIRGGFQIYSLNAINPSSISGLIKDHCKDAELVNNDNSYKYKSGFGVSTFTCHDLTATNELKITLGCDYYRKHYGQVKFAKTSSNSNQDQIVAKLHDIYLNTDCVHYMGNNKNGLYIFLGAGVRYRSIGLSEQNSEQNKDAQDQKKSKVIADKKVCQLGTINNKTLMQASAGAGYAVTDNFDVECRYNHYFDSKKQYQKAGTNIGFNIKF